MSGECQLLAELRMLQQRQPQHPVLGLLVNPTMMSVYIPKPAQRTEYQYAVVNRDVRDLEMVLHTIDIVFGHLTSGKNPSMDKQIVNHDLKEQANT